MELRTYLEILWRRKWVIATTAMATLAIVVVGTLMITPSYRALSTIRVAMAASGPISYTDYMYAERLMNTYAELATSRPVLDELANELGDRVPAQIKVEVMPDTELIHIIVEDANPVLASEAANTLAEILVAQSRRLYASGSKTAAEILGEQVTQTEEELKQEQREYEAAVLQSPNDSERIDALGRSIALKQETYNTLLQQYESARATEAIRANALSVVESATTPQAPSKPSKVLNVALGCMVGLMGGVGLAFLFEHLDTRLHTVEQIEEATALPTLGRIPYTRKGPHNIALDGSSPQREAYRRLRTGIYAAGQGAALRTLLVTSAQPGEGKSTIVTNLAAAMAQDGLQVLVVDGDLRRPTLHTNFCLSNTIGLTSILGSELRLQEAVQNTKIFGVSLLTSGPLPSDPAELLGSRQMIALLDEMPLHFDLALIDTPALLPVTDAAVVAPLVDGVLLVVQRANAGREAVRSACRELASIGARMVGVVVSRANEGPGHRYYGSYGYYRMPDATPRRDRLTKINGIDSVYEKALNALGIVSFAQLAEQDPDTLAEKMDVLASATPIRRDRWIEQAQAFLHSQEHV